MQDVAQLMSQYEPSVQGSGVSIGHRVAIKRAVRSGSRVQQHRLHDARLVRESKARRAVPSWAAPDRADKARRTIERGHRTSGGSHGQLKHSSIVNDLRITRRNRVEILEIPAAPARSARVHTHVVAAVDLLLIQVAARLGSHRSTDRIEGLRALILVAEKLDCRPARIRERERIIENVDVPVPSARVRQRSLDVQDGIDRHEPPFVARVPGIAVTALKSHRIRQGEARSAAGSGWHDLDLIFASSIGTPLEPRNVTRLFKHLLATAGLPDMRLHDLRHSCATLLLAQGVNPRVVMETLGHSQVSLTLNTYSHVLPALQQDAANKMDAILGGS
jgi:integrase